MLWYHMCVKYGTAEREREREREGKDWINADKWTTGNSGLRGYMTFCIFPATSFHNWNYFRITFVDSGCRVYAIFP